MVTEQIAYEALRLAQVNEHAGSMPGSAKLNTEEAEKAFNTGDFERAYKRAIRSLEYSVGIFGEAYRKAVALAK